MLVPVIPILVDPGWVGVVRPERLAEHRVRPGCGVIVIVVIVDVGVHVVVAGSHLKWHGWLLELDEALYPT